MFEGIGKEYKKRNLEINFPCPAPSSAILTVAVPLRLEILKNLCEFHLESPEHFWELLRVKDGESEWRIESIGEDSLLRRYWLLSDGRMYREKEKLTSNKKEKEKEASQCETNWELVCFTRKDYDEFLLTGLPSQTKTKDRSLLKIVRDEIIPKVEPILSYQLAQHRKYFRPTAVVSTKSKAASNNTSSSLYDFLPRKRSSRLIEKEIEEFKRREEEEAAEKERQKILKLERQNNLILLQNQNLTHQNSYQIKPVEQRPVVDLKESRESRAEMRNLKKEKEFQVKAIEEAFFSTYKATSVESESESDTESDTETESDNQEVDIECDDKSYENNYNNHQQNYNEMMKSPIKLILKFHQPTPTPIKTENIPEELEEGPIQQLQLHQNQNQTSTSSLCSHLEKEHVAPEEGNVEILNEETSIVSAPAQESEDVHVNVVDDIAELLVSGFSSSMTSDTSEL